MQALRTESAKLIVYPGHDEWAELYDLQKDPFATQNLISNPGYPDLLARLRTQFLNEQQQAASKH